MPDAIQAKVLAGWDGVGNPVRALEVAAARANLGDLDEAFRLLEVAYQIRHSRMAWIGKWPELRAVRGDPRFRDWSRRLNLPDAELPGRVE